MSVCKIKFNIETHSSLDIQFFESGHIGYEKPMFVIFFNNVRRILENW